MAAPQRVTVVTPSGQVVTGVTTARARPGSTVTVLVGSGANTRQATGQVVGAGQSRGRSSSSSLVGAGGAAAATSIVPEAADVRFLDGLITAAVAAVTVVWTATRKPGQDFAWAIFWSLLGLVMAVEGRGFLRYGGFGVLAANVSYVALRLAGLAKVQYLRTALTEAAAIAADGRGQAAYAARQARAAAPAPAGQWGMRAG